MSQSRQSHLPLPPRRQAASDPYGGSRQDELHMTDTTLGSQDQKASSSLDNVLSVKLELPTSPVRAHHHLQALPSSPQSQSQSPQQPLSGSVPGVLQPGGPAALPLAVSSKPASVLSGSHDSMPPPPPPLSHQLRQQPQQHLQRQQHQHPQQEPEQQPQHQHQHHEKHQQLSQPSSHELQTPSKASSLTMPHSHPYSCSSPVVSYDASSNYHAYTPATPSGASPQFMSPTEASKYDATGSRRNFSSTPLGLADIRPRADSAVSDGPPGMMAHSPANFQPGPSSYLAPWAVYAFDWCKWTPQGTGAGKLAVGSYLEDGHNFVCVFLPPLFSLFLYAF